MTEEERQVAIEEHMKLSKDAIGAGHLKIAVSRDGIAEVEMTPAGEAWLEKLFELDPPVFVDENGNPLDPQPKPTIT